MDTWCVAEQHCRDYNRHTDLPGIATDTPLCQPCLRVGARAVRVLVYDYVDLEQCLPRPPGHGEHVTGTKEAPIPLAVHVEALQREIWTLSTTWEQILRERHRLAEAPTRVRDGWAVQHALATIAPRVPELASLPSIAVMLAGEPVDQSGAEALLAMIFLHGRVRTTLGLTALVVELPGECPTCGLPALRRDNGADTVYCQHCAAWRTDDEYRRDVALVLIEHKPKRRHRTSR